MKNFLVIDDIVNFISLFKNRNTGSLFFTVFRNRKLRLERRIFKLMIQMFQYLVGSYSVIWIICRLMFYLNISRQLTPFYFSFNPKFTGGNPIRLLSMYDDQAS